MKAVLYVLTGGAVLFAIFGTFALNLWAWDQPYGSKARTYFHDFWKVAGQILKVFLVVILVAGGLFMAHDLGKWILT